jgi:single-stranded-DNA-specific exonuclease
MKKVYYPELDETLHSCVLENGLTVAVVPRKGFTKKLAYFVTDYGSIHTDFLLEGKLHKAPAGVAHYLEHKMFDLPGDRDVSAEFASMGAMTNAFTSYDLTAYYFSTTENFDGCLRLLLEFVSTPYFTEESVEKERGIIDQEISMNLDSPDSQVFDSLMESLFHKHPIRVPILGTSETIREITPEVLYNCHRAFYTPVNMLLCVIGDVEPESVAEFLSPAPRRTYDPFLLKNMEEGVSLILEEAVKGSRICIYGDYDADGITSTTLMLSVLSYITDPGQTDYYIPSRFEEGYGLNKEAIQQIYEQGFDMILTVDCGSVSYDEVEFAKSLGMKVLVTDHHTVTDTIADCLVINPKQPGCPYPFKELAGCGVAFKVAQAIQQRADLPKSVINEVLDLVAIGTVGDIMPLVDENRTIVKFGMRIINRSQRAGLARLIEAASLNPGKITSENISYVIVPHLNASGRIENASVAVELLRCSAQPETEAADEMLDDRVATLVNQNIQRKKLQQDTFRSCVEQLHDVGAGDEHTVKDFILIRSEDAHEGIAGIVAGKLKETYYRPTVLVTPSGDEKQYLKGTGRSIAGVSLYELLKKNEFMFEKFGGHASACGFLMKEEYLPQLEENLLKSMEEIKAQEPDIFRRQYDIDLEMEAEEITVDFAKELELLAPFGNGNPKPVFLLTNVTLEDIRYMGDAEQHMRFFARSHFGRRIPCVLFNDAQRYGQAVNVRRPLELIGSLECQVWQGQERLQLLVDEIKFD